ncbi:MAG: bacteriohemerythrin [Lachnospiraceae bacterium]|nr:bacteriohemerythrin [Lachnospiraceae bacterium]
MKEIRWNDRYKIGIAEIDKAHQRLFSIVGKLLMLNEDEEKSKFACAEGIKFFKSYTIKHFEEEEAYMKSIDYGEYETHKKLHDNMRDKTIPALENDLEKSEYSMEAVQHFLGICLGWLNCHIMIEDRAITGKAVSRWVHNPAEEEVVNLENVVIQGMKEVFDVNLWVVSEKYKGEDFGNGIYYRLNYVSQKGKKVQIVLAFEEQLILNTIGQTLDVQVKKVTKMTVDATKEFAQLLMHRIGQHFQSQEKYELVKDNVLNDEQYRKMFLDRYPDYPLLFDTGKGYFAFCVTAR